MKTPIYPYTPEFISDTSIPYFTFINSSIYLSTQQNQLKKNNNHFKIKITLTLTNNNLKKIPKPLQTSSQQPIKTKKQNKTIKNN